MKDKTLRYRGLPIQFDETMGLNRVYQMPYASSDVREFKIAEPTWWKNYAPPPLAGDQFYLSPWWVEVVDYSAKAKIIRYRRLTRDRKAPIERMGRKAFLKTARAG